MSTRGNIPLGKILRRFFRDSLIPLILAIAYTLWTYSAQENPVHPTKIITTFSGSYFLLMWFTGQFLRVSKHLADEKSLSDISASVNTIRTILQSDNNEVGLDNGQESPSVQKTLALDAEMSLKTGQRLSAVLSAAVAFERALRDYSLRVGIVNYECLPAPQLIRMLENTLESGVSEDLRELWKARNTIIHYSESDLQRLPDIDALINGFTTAIDFLAKHQPNKPPS